MTQLSKPTVSDKPQSFTDWLRKVFRTPVNAVARAAIRLGISPNAITILGFVLSLIPAVLAAQGKFQLAGLLYLFITPLDALDGAVARLGGRVSRLGGVLDSTLDRYGEAILLGAIAYRMTVVGNVVAVMLVFASLFGSVMVSYIRARSEALGIDNKVGIMTRVERIVVVAVGLLIGQVVPMLWVLAIFTQATVIQRLWKVYHAGDESAS
jgi:CDP-diacylglycerol--glycerol-3-phosphate 3-phosphatidyltransferase